MASRLTLIITDCKEMVGDNRPPCARFHAYKCPYYIIPNGIDCDICAVDTIETLYHVLDILKIEP